MVKLLETERKERSSSFGKETLKEPQRSIQSKGSLEVLKEGGPSWDSRTIPGESQPDRGMEEAAT